MSNKNRSPYQPPLPQKKVVKPPVSMGYPAPKKSFASQLQKSIDANVKATEILKELGVEASAREFLKLLEDEKRLNEVVRKLKLKAFW